jgi:hypothetical protein
VILAVKGEVFDLVGKRTDSELGIVAFGGTDVKKYLFSGMRKKYFLSEQIGSLILYLSVQN